MQRSLNYAILLCVGSSIVVGVGICMFVKDFRLGSGTGMILWIGLTALSATNALSGALRIHKVVRALVSNSQ